jgi:hypothetical protein
MLTPLNVIAKLRIGCPAWSCVYLNSNCFSMQHRAAPWFSADYANGLNFSRQLNQATWGRGGGEERGMQKITTGTVKMS